MRMPVLPLKPKTVLNGRYEIVKLLGHGGFGNTYSVYNSNLDTYCVVKEFALDQICARDFANKTIVPIDGYEPVMKKWRNKFVDEAKNLAKVRHQGVVSVFEVWKENGTVYYAMDHIEGGELPDSRNKAWRPMAWTEAKKLAAALLEALQAVHEVGLLHGDIKPANILIDKKSKLPILIDFGTARSLAKAQDETVTSLAYTAGYAPIELQDRDRSKEAKPSSDLYSWAMVVIGLVAKHYDKGWPVDAKTRIMLSDVNADKYSEEFLHRWLANLLPTSMISILANCLRLNSDQRPKSASFVLEQLENLSSFNSIPKKQVISESPISRSTVVETRFKNPVPKEANRIIEKHNKETSLATIQSRLLAKIIDILPFGLMFFLFIVGFFWRKEESFFLILGLLSMIQIYFLVKDGQTIGRKLMKIKIVRMNDQPASFWRILFLRILLPIAIVIFIIRFINEGSYFYFSNDEFLSLLLVFIIIMNILPIFSTNRRCIHDFFADTKVVKE